MTIRKTRKDKLKSDKAICNNLFTKALRILQIMQAAILMNIILDLLINQLILAFKHSINFTQEDLKYLMM
jgi:hypothetical protein